MPAVTKAGGNASNAARFSLGYAPHEGSFASRGTLRLRSANPDWHPSLEPNYFDQQADLEALFFELTSQGGARNRNLGAPAAGAGQPGAAPTQAPTKAPTEHVDPTSAPTEGEAL